LSDSYVISAVYETASLWLYSLIDHYYVLCHQTNEISKVTRQADRLPAAAADDDDGVLMR